MDINFMKESEPNRLIGNTNLFSNDEGEIAKYLREKNLENVNEMAQAVHPNDTFYTRYGKRFFDILVSLPICLMLLPFNCIFAICTFFDVGRPILYKQTRVGKDGKYFAMVKFRNMNEKKDENGRFLPPSQRVTKFGYFMRKFSLDELLSFWSILKGDMSLIGPRPMPVFIHERMNNRHLMRTTVRPGLECPRVIHIEGEEIFKYQRTYENDIWYVENVSFLLDIKMIFMLVKMVFSLSKRKNQAKVENISYFVGYNENGYALSLNNYKELYSLKTDKIKESYKYETNSAYNSNRDDGINNNSSNVEEDKRILPDWG